MLSCVGGVGWVFLVLACVLPCCGVVGVGAFWGWAFVMDTLSGSRSIPVGRDAPSSSSFSSFCWGCGGGVWLAVGSACCVWGWWCGGLFVICIVVVSILFVLWFCLVLLGIRWMPWHQELMKDVAACDMPRGVGERVLIRGCPNGGT